MKLKQQNMNSINVLSKKILNLIDYYIRKIDGKIDRTLEFYIKLENTESKKIEWIRIIFYAYSSYRVVAYTICKNKNDLEKVSVFCISCDHDSTWRYNFLERIIENENTAKQKRKNYNYAGFIDLLSLRTSSIEKNHNEGLLFVKTIDRNSLNIYI